MRVKTEVKFIDNFDKLERILEELDDMETSTGFYDSKPHFTPDGEQHSTIPQIAYWIEYGTKNMPDRPFMTTSFMSFRPVALGDLGDMVKDIMNLKPVNVKSELNKIGKKFKDNVQDVIDSGDTLFKSNSDLTLELKAPETRLFYHTGQMVDGLEYKVEKKENT